MHVKSHNHAFGCVCAFTQARPGDGVPREAIPTMVNLKRSQLKGAAEQLRARAKRLRETTKVQKVFQQGVMHLRKSWRIVAPNHGKVCVQKNSLQLRHRMGPKIHLQFVCFTWEL